MNQISCTIRDRLRQTGTGKGTGIRGQNGLFCALRCTRPGEISSGYPSPRPFQPNMGMSPWVPQFDPEFHTQLFLRFSTCRFHPNRFPVKMGISLRAPGQNHIWPHQPRAISAKYGYATGGNLVGIRIFNPAFPTVFTMPIPPKSIPGQNWIFLCAAPHARAWAKSVLASPTHCHSSQIWVCHRGTPIGTRMSHPAFPRVFTMPIPPKLIPSQNGSFFACRATRARLDETSSAQPSPGPLQQNMGMSPGVPQFDAKFPTQLVPRFFTMPIRPKLIPGQMEILLRYFFRVYSFWMSSNHVLPGENAPEQRDIGGCTHQPLRPPC